MINLIRGYAPLPLRGIHPHNKTPNRATPEKATLLSRNTFKAGKERERQQDQDPNNTAQYERVGQDKHRKAPYSATEQRKSQARLSLTIESPESIQRLSVLPRVQLSSREDCSRG